MQQTESVKENNIRKPIDIEKILKAKAGSKAKFIPWFVKRWLKKTLHEDEVNRFLTGDGDNKYGVDFLDACVEYLKADVVVNGLDELPENTDGRYFTIVSNHPLGGADGVVLGKLICHKYDSKMKYLVRDELMNLKGLAPLCIPINKTGNQSRDFPKMVEAAFQSESNVLMFPAGLCSRKMDDGTIHDLPWKKTFVAKSVQYKRDVIPVHFSGRNSDRFYNIARFCAKHKMKFNLAMLYLVDEMYKNVGKQFTVTFGKPIPWETFTDKSKSYAQWAAWVEDLVYTL